MTPAFNKEDCGKHWGDKRLALLIVSMLSAALLFWKITPVNMRPTVKTVISQQRAGVTGIDQPRNIASTKTFFLDSVFFPEGTTLVHRRLGPLGFSNDFFIDIETRFTLANTLSLEWSIESDDGFRLSIDGELIAEFLGDRPYAASIKRTEMSPGTHTLRLIYFQGFGKLGLRGTYQVGDFEPLVIGQSGRGVVFEEFPANPPK